MASVHTASRPSSIASRRRNTGYESDQSSDTAAEDDIVQPFPMAPTSNLPPMWALGAQPSPMARKLGHGVSVAEIPIPAPIRTQDDDVQSRSSTLGGDEQDFEFPEKTPRPKTRDIKPEDEEDAAPEKPHVPGPLEKQLMGLMSKLVFMERENPTISVTPEEFQALQKRVEDLEAEKKTWQKKHEALYALRDEDVENNIKIRGMLAKERREHDAMKKLRDEDLENVLIVRSKLAEATRKIERLEKEASSSSGNRSPPSGRRSVLDRRSTSMDLFAVAKTAALEQRALELEKRNGDLLAQIDTLKGGASIDDLNRLTAHKAWKDTVNELETKLKTKDQEISRLKNSISGNTVSSTSSRLSSADFDRMEALHEDHARYREKMGQKIQALRGENEHLLRDLHRKEDQCHDLEERVEKLQRRISVM